MNTPNNPTGRVLDREELQAVADCCMEHDLIAITDEIYEHILYEGTHIPLATFEGMRERTVTVSGASKTFSVTGWRIGWIVAPEALTAAIRKVHDFLTVGAPAPLQEAVAVGMRELGASYYSDLADGYRQRRDALIPALQAAGFSCSPPQGAYYVLADFSALSSEDDDTLCQKAGGQSGSRCSARFELLFSWRRVDPAPLCLLQANGDPSGGRRQASSVCGCRGMKTSV